MALTIGKSHSVIPTDETYYFLISTPACSMQLTPESGATVTVHYTVTPHYLWENADDDTDAQWEPVGSTYEFTAIETIHFQTPITGIRVASADEATTIDIVGA